MNKTKLKILSSAGELFFDKGYHGTALDTILGVINVSKGSFFYHFRSKDDLLLELLDHEAEKLFDILENFENAQMNSLQKLNKFLDWRKENYESDGRLIYKLGSEVGNHDCRVQKKIKKVYGKYLSYLINMIESAKQQGQLTETTPTKELSNFILYGLEGANMSVKLTENEQQYSDVVEMVKRVVRSYRVI